MKILSVHANTHIRGFPVVKMIKLRLVDFKMMQISQCNVPDSKVHGANMGPTWVLSAPNGPHVGPMNLVIRGCSLVSVLWLYIPLSRDTDFMLSTCLWLITEINVHKYVTNWGEVLRILSTCHVCNCLSHQSTLTFTRDISHLRS